MAATTPAPDATEIRRDALHRRSHARCFACGTPGPAAPGLGLVFSLAADGAAVEAEWNAPAWATSYEDIVHGGLLATALDAAMVHVLFAHGLVARTASLRIRYRHPVLVSAPCRLHASLTEKHGPLRRLSATLHQSGRLCVRAEADFLPAPSRVP